MEPILQPYLGREQSQKSYLIILSQKYHPRPQPEQWTNLKIHPDGKSHLSKDITIRHVQKPKMSQLVKNSVPKQILKVWN